MRTLRWLSALAVMFVLVAGVQAGEDTTKKQKKAAAVQGVIEKVDGEAKTITVKVGRKKDDPTSTPTSVTVSYSDATKFVLRSQEGEKEAKASDLAAGKRVQIVKETRDGKEVASQVTIVERKKDGQK